MVQDPRSPLNKVKGCLNGQPYLLLTHYAHFSVIPNIRQPGM